MDKELKILRILGILEGISYMVLLFVGVPLKHVYHDPSIVRIFGMPHGLLFIGFNVVAYNRGVEKSWPKKIKVHALLASLLPLGTFAFDRKYLRAKD